MIRWNWIFVDRPADRFDEAFTFWTAISGTRLSRRHGEFGEFATLEPTPGDAYVAAQAVGGAGGAHLDIDVEDLDRARRTARDLGATLVADHDTWSLVHSPSGLAFCLTSGDGSHIPAPVTGPEGDRSRVDQLCLDIPPSAYAAETEFWAALTGWPVQRTGRPEFTRLLVPTRLPVRILMQRVGAEQEPAAHIDIACADIETTAAWHESLGARRVRRGAHWWVMRDPVGVTYCLTGRDPLTGKVSRRTADR
ncbi:VOC family protein [Nocardia spumae]|uniref:VOC family protein n=1 Tax=Nocardia spumae TaxID=2887190 RepID=UPI001D14B7B6|nr:VOC family protein [Nocardia spumae]